MCVGNTGPALNVGFPALCYQDGPLGVRFADNITGFPAGITVAATWNKKLMYARGQAHGKEARLKGVNVLLSPVAGPLGRHPAGGRNWEGFSPDSYLTGRLEIHSHFIQLTKNRCGIRRDHQRHTIIQSYCNNQTLHTQRARALPPSS